MDAKLKGSTHMEKRIERAVEANQRVGWMGRVNGVMRLSEGLPCIWESMGLPAVNFAVEVSWKGTKAQQKSWMQYRNKRTRRYWEQVEQWHHAQ